MLYIGPHLSISKGYYAMGKTALMIGANTFQFFSRNPRGGKNRPLDCEDINRLAELMHDNHFGKIMCHAPYTINPCSASEDNRAFAVRVMKEDIERMELLPENFYNFHPGCHVGQGVKTAVEYISKALNDVLSPDQTTTVLLETMSGKGSEIGRSFDELKEIIDAVKLKEKIGVCLDTCHVFDGGYDIVNSLENVIDEFDKIIGLEYLKAIHLNDSMNLLGSHKDRHAPIGKGNIGLAAFENIINNKHFRNLPFFLETPNELDGYASEIALLKGLYNTNS